MGLHLLVVDRPMTIVSLPPTLVSPLDQPGEMQPMPTQLQKTMEPDPMDQIDLEEDLLVDPGIHMRPIEPSSDPWFVLSLSSFFGYRISLLL